MRDELFIRGKVPMTKEEVRTVSLAKLQLMNATHFLDIGAGTGSVSIEAAATFPKLQVTAIEENPEAVTLIKENAVKFKTTNLKVVQAKAPIPMETLFDGIFVGGSKGNLLEILEWSFAHLVEDGHLVLNFILQENAFEAIQWLASAGYIHEVIQLQVSTLTKLGKGHYYKPKNPIIIIDAIKGKEDK